MDTTWLVRGVLGGVLVGASASLLLLGNGRIAGISGILATLLHPLDPSERAWRLLFVVGLLLGTFGAALALPGALAEASPGLGLASVSGLLVGVGTRLGNGCTSGHGVCGLSRFSPRALAATLTFIATGALAVLAARLVGGAG